MDGGRPREGKENVLELGTDNHSYLSFFGSLSVGIIMDDKRLYLYGERGTSDSFFSISVVKILETPPAEKGCFRKGWTERDLGNLLAVGPIYYFCRLTSIGNTKNTGKKEGKERWTCKLVCLKKKWSWITHSLLPFIDHGEDEGDMAMELGKLKLTTYLIYLIPTIFTPVRLIKKIFLLCFSSFPDTPLPQFLLYDRMRLPNTTVGMLIW